MRETRPSGSEGGEPQNNAASLPLSGLPYWTPPPKPSPPPDKNDTLKGVVNPAYVAGDRGETFEFGFSIVRRQLEQLSRELLDLALHLLPSSRVILREERRRRPCRGRHHGQPQRLAPALGRLERRLPHAVEQRAPPFER